MTSYIKEYQRIFFSFQITRHYILVLCVFISFFANIVSSADVETKTIENSQRTKREIYFRPLFVYRQQQKRYNQRLKHIHEILLQQQINDQNHLENYPSVLINNEFHQSVPLNQLSVAQQIGQQEYYRQYYNKYFQQYPQSIYNVL